jgi:hypothetical protein
MSALDYFLRDALSMILQGLGFTLIIAGFYVLWVLFSLLTKDNTK